MKELNRKVFWTIFLLLSGFVFIGLLIINVINYRQELESVERSLMFSFTDREINGNMPPRDDNFIIMDHEVYTVSIEDNQITDINYHGITDTSFDVEKIANQILKNNTSNRLKIGNLYFSSYSYYFEDGNNIVIINITDSNQRLVRLLLESLLFLVLAEALLSLIVSHITSWIVQPAKDAFDRQKNFIADASHELKTPLSVIMASSDEIKKDKKNQKYVENIQFESDRMRQLLTSMLDLSKLESGITKETYRDENISKITEKMCLSFEGIAFEKKVSIDSNIQDDLILHCSKEEMEKLISILLDNAIKHSYEDTSVSVSLKKEKNNLFLLVSNHGDPIPEDSEEKIFERFYRVDKARNRKENRYGLGLAIAKNIVLNHNGTIKAHSKDGITTFQVIFKK